LIWIKYEDLEVSHAEPATINYWRGQSHEKDEHARSNFGGSRDFVRRADFGSVVAREGLVRIVEQCLRPSRKTGNCNERRWRCAESGSTGGTPLRNGSYLLGFRPSLLDVEEAIRAKPGFAFAGR
jgi:hypothetical protein